MSPPCTCTAAAGNPCGGSPATIKPNTRVLKARAALAAEAAAAPEPAAATADGGDGPEARLLNQDAASEDVTSPMDGFELVPLQTLAQCVAATLKTGIGLAIDPCARRAATAGVSGGEA